MAIFWKVSPPPEFILETKNGVYYLKQKAGIIRGYKTLYTGYYDDAMLIMQNTIKRRKMKEVIPTFYDKNGVKISQS